MPRTKDYRRSLNEGLYNAFHRKHILSLFDFIIKEVEDAPYLPENEEELRNWCAITVKEALLFKKFRTHLTKYVEKSIRRASANKKEPEVIYESALAQCCSVNSQRESVHY